jgi:lantibiotic biosynthesis protein
MRDDSYAPALSAALARRLATPEAARRWTPEGNHTATWMHSLSRGVAGIALLHAERARAELDSWATFHGWARTLTTGLSGGHGLYAGVPAVAHVLATAADANPAMYRSALTTLNSRISRDTIARTRTVHARIDQQTPSDSAEWDVVSGITGLVRHLLRRAPGDPAIKEALKCLIRVVQPIRHQGTLLPGWWSDRDPHRGYSKEWAGGHGNFGLAHGAASILAILALTTLRDIEMPGQQDAAAHLYEWYQRWQQPSPAGPWWPQYISIAELAEGQLHQPQPGRPSWCYGTPGIARALQLADRAFDMPDAGSLASAAIAATFGPQSPAAPLTDLSLCHGYAGTLHTARHLGEPADDLVTATLNRLDEEPDAAADALLAAGPQLMEGATGVALALLSYTTDPSLTSTWDTFLLLS